MAAVVVAAALAAFETKRRAVAVLRAWVLASGFARAPENLRRGKAQAPS